MTQKQSAARLAFYGIAAFLTPIGAKWGEMEHATLYQWGGVLIQSIIASIIAVRAYIDQTPSRVDPP